jgi:hypothetical protein
MAPEPFHPTRDGTLRQMGSGIADGYARVGTHTARRAHRRPPACVRRRQRARELGRTLITLDHDFLDDTGFPAAKSGGVLVLAAPAEQGLRRLLTRVDARLFRKAPLPLQGRKLHVHVDWVGDDPDQP